MEVKVCPSCKETKTRDLFYQNKNSKINCSPYCKVCSNLRTTSYVKNNTDKLKPKKIGYALKRRYGITPQDYEQLLESQNFCCAICNTPQCQTGRNLAVDHCHITNKIRGLLCSDCNTGLGHFKDSLELLDRAKDYLNGSK